MNQMVVLCQHNNKVSSTIMTGNVHITITINLSKDITPHRYQREVISFNTSYQFDFGTFLKLTIYTTLKR